MMVELLELKKKKIEIEFILLQHLVLGIKFAVAYAIPDIPEWVENEIAKMEFQRREALKVQNARLHNDRRSDHNIHSITVFQNFKVNEIN